MWREERQRLFNIRQRRFDILLRQTDHEIQVEAIESARGGLDGSDGLRPVMNATEGLQ